MKKYAPTHEWYEDLGGGKVRVGVSRHAAHELSDIVFVELPDAGKQVPDKGSVCVLESVKAVSDVYAPAGKVVEVNEALREKPSLVNEDPEGAGWLVTMQLEDAGSLSAFLGPEDYLASLEKK
jgi:glycine cleavage system H protein